MKHEGPLLAALALLSAAVTTQQVALMQVLGWMHWHHFAYMIVAIALLGFGIAGTVLSLAREFLLKHEAVALPWLFLLTALTIPAGVQLAQLELVAVDLPLVFFNPASNAWRLAALCLFLLPPFFCSGLATGLILTVHAQRAGRYYASSLAGAGFGGLLGLALVSRIEPPQLPSATAAIALLGTVCLVLSGTRRGTGANDQLPQRVSDRGPIAASKTFVIFACITTAYIGTTWFIPMELRPSQFKPLSRTLDLPDARIIAAAPSVHGWIQIVDAPALRPSPAVSFSFSGQIPPHPAVFINGIGYGSLPAAESISQPAWLDFTTDAAAFAAAKPRRVLLLENGPGGWATYASHVGAERITVTEPNHALLDLLTGANPPLAPEWRLPSVSCVNASGRAFLRRTSETFDVIRFPSVGELGGSAGLSSTTEQFLLTRQAFSDAWARLSPTGVIAVTAWMDFPERNSLATARHAGRNRRSRRRFSAQSSRRRARMGHGDIPAETHRLV